MREPYIGHPVTRVKVNRAVRIPVTAELLEHIEFLTSIGMNNYMIARSAGVTSTTVRNLRLGSAAGSTVDVHRALMGVTPRPSKHQAGVLSFGALRRLNGLAVMGWSSAAIGDLMGVDRTWARAVRTRRVINWPSHIAIDEVYAELSHRDGGNYRTKGWAARSGFVHPFMWDDIDDWFEVPVAVADSGAVDEVVVERLVAGVATRAVSAERKAAFGVLLGRGVTVSAAAVAVGLNHRTALKYSSEVAA